MRLTALWTAAVAAALALSSAAAADPKSKTKSKSKAKKPAAAAVSKPVPAPAPAPAPASPAAPAPPAEEECKVDILHLPRKLADGHPDFESPVKLQRSTQKSLMTETVTLKDGRTLTATQGGCSHFLITFELTPIEDKTKLTDRGHWLDVAASLLERQLSPKDEPLDDLAASVLRLAAPTANAKPDKAGKTTGVALSGSCDAKSCASTLPCGDATCTVEMRRLDPQRATLRFLYDFPL